MTGPHISICWATMWIPGVTAHQRTTQSPSVPVHQDISWCQWFLLDKQKREHHGCGPALRRHMGGSGSIGHRDDQAASQCIQTPLHDTSPTALLDTWLALYQCPASPSSWLDNKQQQQSVGAYGQLVLHLPRLETKMTLWLLAIWVQEIFFCKFWYTDYKDRIVLSLRNQNLFHSPIRGVKGRMEAMLKI